MILWDVLSGVAVALDKPKDVEKYLYGDNDLVNGLVIALVFGLLVAFVSGLGVGLVTSLSVALILGLMFGLVTGLALGFGFGLSVASVFGLVAGLVTGFGVGLPPTVTWLGALLAVFVLTEIIFQSYREKPGKGENTFWFTAKQKAVAVFESVMILANLNALRVGIEWLSRKWPEYWPFIEKVLGWVGIALVVILALWLWVKANETKYAKKEEKKRGVEK
jgi:MFS family permease